MNIRYFFVTDQVSKGNLEIEYCPTGDMVGDFMTKLLEVLATYSYVPVVIIIIWCNIHTGCTFDPGATTSSN